MSAASVAAELANLSMWPTRPNTLDGTCLVDGGPVARGSGRIALRRDGLGTFAGYLHKDCAERVRELQAKRTQAPAALEVTGSSR